MPPFYDFRPSYSRAASMIFDISIRASRLPRNFFDIAASMRQVAIFKERIRDESPGYRCTLLSPRYFRLHSMSATPSHHMPARAHHSILYLYACHRLRHLPYV
jgi:hypothetical protein